MKLLSIALFVSAAFGQVIDNRSIVMPGSTSGFVIISPPAVAGAGSTFTPVAGASISLIPSACSGGQHIASVSALGVIVCANNTEMNGTVMSSLATGLVKNTTGTGVPSIGVAGTDYQAALTNPVTAPSSMTNTALVTAAGATSIQTAAPTATMDSSGNITTPGSLTTGSGGSNAGFVRLGQGTAPSAGTTNVTLYGGAAITSYTMRLPTAAATGFYLGTNTAGDVVMSQVGSSGSGSVCLTVSCSMTTPTLGAALATSINGLGLTTSTGTLTVPNGVTFTGPASTGTAMALNQANTGTSAITVDLSAATGASALKIPVKASVSTAVNGAIGYDSTTDMLHAAQASADASIPQFTVTPANGDCANWVVSGSKYKLGTAGAGCGSGGSTAGATLFSTTGSTTVTATSATTLIGAVTGSQTVAVNTFTAGQVLEIVAEGYYTTPATPASLTIDLLVGGTVRITTGAVVQIASVTNGVWRLRCMLTTRTAGAGGTQIANCIFEGTGATLTPGEAAMFTSSTWAMDTTATKVIDIQATWSTATGSPTITSTNVAAWIPGAPVTSVDGLTGAVTGITQTIASGTSALGTSAIASAACATVVTTSATGTASTDAIIFTPNASIKALTGYTPATTGGLSIAAYPTANNVNFDVCNWSNASITPSALTLNWRVTR